MKTNLSLVIFAVMMSTGSAFAGELAGKLVLPKDATNARIVTAYLDDYATGVADAGYKDSDENEVYQNTYSKKLYVKVDFNTSDSRYFPAQYDGGPSPWDDPSPSTEVWIGISPAQIAGVQSGQLKATDLVTISLNPEPVTMDDPSYEYRCPTDNDSNIPDPSCHLDDVIPQVTVSLPVLSFILK